MNACQQVSTSPWANAAVFATALGALVFVVTYAWTTRGAWRDSNVGMNVMAFMSAIMAVSLLAVAGIIWGTNWPHRDVIRTAAWGLIAGCIWWRVAILWRVQHTREPYTRSERDMWTTNFWKQAGERAIKTFAQAALALMTVDGLGVLDVDWPAVGSVGGLAAIVSVLTSVITSKIGEPNDPSAVRRTDTTT